MSRAEGFRDAKAHTPEQSALKPQRKQRMQPLIFASWRVSPQFSQKSTGVEPGDGASGELAWVDDSRLVTGGASGFCTMPIMHRPFSAIQT